MGNYKLQEKGNHLPLRDKVKNNREEYWRIKHLKEAVLMLGYSDPLSRPNIEMNIIWGKKKKERDMIVERSIS